MSFNYTPSRKLNIVGAIEDASGMLMKVKVLCYLEC